MAIKDPHHHLYWRRNLRLLLVLLFIWFMVSFGFGILLVDSSAERRVGKVWRSWGVAEH